MANETFEILKKACGYYEGEGINHEGQVFAGRFLLKPILDGGGFAIEFSATGKDGIVYHKEESRITPSLGEKLTLWNFNTNTPGLVPHQLTLSTSKPESLASLIFGFGKPSDSKNFREEIVLDIWSDGDVSYTYSWGLPGGEFKERSGVRMVRKESLSATLGHIQLNTPKLEEQVEFYEKYFSFRRKAHGKGWFLWNQAGFLMAVNPLPEQPVMPEWFHIGFRYESTDEVKALYERLKADGFEVGKLDAFDDYVQFRFPDPTGYVVEVFWEPIPRLW